MGIEKLGQHSRILALTQRTTPSPLSPPTIGIGKRVPIDPRSNTTSDQHQGVTGAVPNNTNQHLVVVLEQLLTWATSEASPATTRAREVARELLIEDRAVSGIRGEGVVLNGDHMGGGRAVGRAVELLQRHFS